MTTPNNIQMENPLANAPSSIEWIQTLELGYEQQSSDSSKRESVCFACGKKQPSQPTCSTSSGDDDKKAAATEAGDAMTTTSTATATPTKLMKCSKCHVATYCCRDCQVNDWKKGGHKKSCNSYKRLGMLNKTDATETDINKIMSNIRIELFTRIRFYACPYAVYKYSELGRGFLFIQSNQTLKNLSLAIPKDEYGIPMTDINNNNNGGGRAILMHYLTMGEFDSEVCREDFELTMVRSKLQDVVDNYDPDTHIVLLWRLRCGHIAVGKALLVPDVNICKKLGMDYYSDNPAGAVQLNLDDL